MFSSYVLLAFINTIYKILSRLGDFAKCMWPFSVKVLGNQLGNRPDAKKKVDIFLKFCFIFNEQTLKIDTRNYYPLIVNQIFSALSKEKSEIIFTRYVTRRFFSGILHSYNKYWFIRYLF